MGVGKVRISVLDYLIFDEIYKRSEVTLLRKHREMLSDIINVFPQQADPLGDQDSYSGFDGSGSLMLV